MEYPDILALQKRAKNSKTVFRKFALRHRESRLFYHYVGYPGYRYWTSETPMFLGNKRACKDILERFFEPEAWEIVEFEVIEKIGS